MSMQISFQRATAVDINLLVDFMRRFYEIDHYPFDDKTARAALAGIISDPALGYVWIINDEGVPIGYIVVTLGYSLEYHGRDAFIDEFYIEASHRGRGIGTEALRFIEEACKGLEVNALHLEVERGNKAGQALYKKAGYEGHDRHLMTKRISS